jgi:HK97 family phage prohead protease
MLLDVDVVRNLSATPELRAAGDGDESLGTMTGFFSVFNTWYEVHSAWEGRFLERTAPGAFAETIASDLADMRVLFDHGFDTIGNKVLGPIGLLEEQKSGPYYEVPLFDTSYNRDLLPGLRAGVYGASFRMRVTGEEWDDEPKPSRYNPKGIPERTITRATVMEFGPVTFPANPKASAQVRSTTDTYYERLRQRDQTAFQAAVRSAARDLPDEMVRSLLDGGIPPEQATDFTGQPGARSSGGGEHEGGAPGTGGPSHTAFDDDTRTGVLRALGVL